jgi:hypothetical protein
MALASALTACLASLLARKVMGAGLSLAQEILAGAAAAISALGVLDLKEQATAAKGSVFGLGLCLILAAMALAASKLSGSTKRRLVGLLLGLALAHHAMMVLPLLPLLLWLISSEEADLRFRALTAGTLLWALPGLSLYLYLPLRAALHPAWHWGQISTAPEILAHVLRLLYTQGPQGQPPLPAMLGLRLAADTLGSSAGAMTLCLAALGLWQGLQQGTAWLGLLGLGLPVIALGLYVGTEPRNFHLIGVALLPQAALACALAGAALLGLSARTGPVLGSLLALAGLALLCWQAGPAPDGREKWLAEDYADNLALALPKDAVFVAANDPQIFSLLYLQQAKARRLDTVLFPTGLYWRQEVASSLLKRWPQMRYQADMDIDAFIAANDAGQVLATGSSAPWAAQPHPLARQPLGLVWAFRSPPASLTEEAKRLEAGLSCLSFRQDLEHVDERLAWEAGIKPAWDQVQEMATAYQLHSQAHGHGAADYAAAMAWQRRSRDFRFRADDLQGQQAP